MKQKLFIFSIGLLSLMTSACQLPYLMKSAYHQISFLNQRVPLEETLKDPNLTKDEKRKLELAIKAREFAINKLHLKATQNYTSYVKLNRNYVTYVVSAAPKWDLKAYLWSFPIIGKVPYKGYFIEEDAKQEQNELDREGYDTYMRGVSAYSTLGWFNDPLTSAMLRYHDYDLVNTIIHESVHATIYIKHEADFNERLAVFLGNKGMERFYQEQEGAGSTTLRRVQEDSADEKLFAEFMSGKVKEMEAWYKALPSQQRSEELRSQKFRGIAEQFDLEVLPRMKTSQYRKFSQSPLNNARLINFKTYYQDLSDFEKLFRLKGEDFDKFMEAIKGLESEKNPTQALKNLLL